MVLKTEGNRPTVIMKLAISTTQPHPH